MNWTELDELDPSEEDSDSIVTAPLTATTDEALERLAESGTGIIKQMADRLETEPQPLSDEEFEKWGSAPSVSKFSRRLYAYVSHQKELREKAEARVEELEKALTKLCESNKQLLPIVTDAIRKLKEAGL